MRSLVLAALLLYPAWSGSTAAQNPQTPAAPAKSAPSFDAAATEALSAMRARAGELHITGVAVVATFEGETIQTWKSEMLVVGRYKDDPKADKADDKGVNLLAVAYAKAAQMADTHRNSGTQTRQPLTGEFPWNGGVIERGRSGYLIAAFSGGASEDDVKVAQAGMAKLKSTL